MGLTLLKRKKQAINRLPIVNHPYGIFRGGMT